MVVRVRKTSFKTALAASSALAVAGIAIAQDATSDAEEQRVSDGARGFAIQYEHLLAGVSEPGTNFKIAASWQFGK